ncbi:hypothetical protein HBA54_15775 [Pelagibius litoralis]|uniref:Uncharacterized protein n=1 Tax=Pelagibius litoralis TaxID=374515 RepID=A0A967KAW3_9PROT|nr:hypothetical protein [Pelagibius litoralis]
MGKTTIGSEISASLSRSKVAHTFLDMDALAETYPRPPDDRFASRLALLNLRDVWTNCSAAGSRNLIVARVIETQHELEEIRRRIPNSRSTICQLRASDETLIERVRTRELGSGRNWHEARAVELSRSLQRSAPADFLVDTEGRSPLDIADEVVARINWVTES